MHRFESKQAERETARQLESLQNKPLRAVNSHHFLGTHPGETRLGVALDAELWQVPLQHLAGDGASVLSWKSVRKLP